MSQANADDNNADVLNTENVDKLVQLIEEATRATSEAPTRFVEPARGTLDRAKAKRHHIVFGRRGSGKTSLLQKARADLSLERQPVAFVDLEAFKGHSYPDVLLSVLIATLEAFDGWLSNEAVKSASFKSYWQRLFGEKPRRPPLNKHQVEILRSSIQKHVSELQDVLHSADDAEVKQTLRSENEATLSTSSRVGAEPEIPSLGKFQLGRETAKGAKETSSIEIAEAAKRSKNDYLLRHILDYQKVFAAIADASDGNAYIFLDDLYHIRKSDQASVIDYFHRIAKGKGVWLKIGTIRHRTEWYHHGNPPVGLKLGDDCDEIDLDITLEKYSLAKEFLYSILDKLIREAGLKSYRGILSDGAVDRLVLASGGVARDFLTICRRSIDVARERGGGVRGPRVGAEDVNTAAGEHDASKRDELRRDTLEERQELELALAAVQKFCMENKANCLLIERDKESEGMRLIGELVDLRFLHIVASRLSVQHRQGHLYSAYMLDISQYTGERKRREMEMIEFWTPQGIDRLRRVGHIFDPDVVFLDETPSAPHQ